MMRPDFLNLIAVEMQPVGSRVTCNPPPINTDEDWLVLVREKDVSKAISLLDDNKFVLDNPSEHYRPEQSFFNSWRGSENTNLIVTFDPSWHYRFNLATKLAKKFNLLLKTDRIALFQAVLYATNYYANLEAAGEEWAKRG